ncbi:MAG: FUN14 domain-containing protein [Halodesulfurarchaeum sp.]|nr:FUN14 domain-containing protein [Halodesulfurarchaeum sp.]
MALELDPTQLGLEFGSGAVIGAIIGFAFKKIAKVIAVLVGIELALFKFLESRGILSVDWNRLSGGIVDVTESAASQTPPSWVNTILSTLSVGAGFTGGFLVGFKKG